MKFRVLNALVDTRKAAADFLVIVDAVIYDQADEVERLPYRLRLLQLRVERALRALEEGKP